MANPQNNKKAVDDEQATPAAATNEAAPKARIRVHSFSLQKMEKTPANIALRLNKCLDKGALVQVMQDENPKTGRLHFCLTLVDGPANTTAHVLREHSHDVLMEKANTILAGEDYKAMTWSHSTHSNLITTALFVRRR